MRKHSHGSNATPSGIIRDHRPLRRSALAAGTLALAGAAWQANAAQSDLYEVVSQTPELSTFYQAVKAAGLDGALKEAPAKTVFAPTNEAFAALPPGAIEALLEPQNKAELQTLLKGHMIAGALPAAQVRSVPSHSTKAGGWVQVMEIGEGLGELRLNGADGPAVKSADLLASNGVVHTIDAIVPAD